MPVATLVLGILLSILGSGLHVAASSPVMAQTRPDAATESFEFCAIGDVPYFIPEDYPRFDKLIAQINKVKPAFTVHVGDFKKGSSACSDEAFKKVLGQFDHFEGPLVFTPGDNEWTDCHRPKAGSYDPLERLARLRQLFFVGPTSLGQTRLRLTRQSETAGYEPFVENARWTKGPVKFLTVHAVGSNNNLMRNEAAMSEYLARNAANLAWIRDSLRQAKAESMRAVVIFMQADPLFEKYDNERSGFVDLLDVLEVETMAFPGQVVLVHGDTHVFRVDKPLKNSKTGRMIDSFTRVEVFAEHDMHAVRIKVDPAVPELFSFQVLQDGLR